ncbi:iron ABC transporter ATP-binding protein [Agromyces laixinhei]|uniref:iron ABC transporter ATP-binding protein n=1 Tax=Agromyces laixinhei TaxID=2585717 RepID=UPI001116ACE5|nr:iron ABC transporter ATP-binding protein [Agromyces laixinhei]
MLRSPHPFRVRPAVTVALVAAASVMLLSGCTGEAAAPENSTAPPQASEAPDSSASPEPTETAEPTVPFAIECDALVTADQLYAFNPNFGTAPDYSPKGEHVVAVVEEDGTACGWMNQTSGEIIEVAVSTPSPAALLAHKNEAAVGSTAVPTYGTPPAVEGYFRQTSGTGAAQIFTGPYWIVIASPVLFEPGDAGQLVADVLGNLPPA